jgi:PhnB protein
MLNAYLHFPGNCEQALTFYAEVLGGQLESLLKHGDTPMKEHVDDAWQDKVIHAVLRIGDAVLMASDAPALYYKVPQGFAVCLTISTAEAERIFPLLAEGGNVTMPLQKTFWAERFGNVTDRFGTPWRITGGRVPKA